MSTLNLNLGVLAFDDSPSSNNPRKRGIDWASSWLGLPISNDENRKIEIEALQELTVFDGTRVLTLDNTTQIAVSLSALDSSRYRLAWTGTGTAPGFRTARAVAVAGGNAVLTLNANQTVTVTHSAGAIFAAVQVGDIVFIPGASTGDTSVFDSLNEGEWTVLSANTTTLVLSRLAGAVFSGKTETVALTVDTQFQVYSADGVQIGDSVDIVSGFAVSLRHSYKIEAVTARHIEFVSTLPIAAETLLPGATSLQIFSAAKRLVYIETDQEVALKFNGQTDECLRLQPFTPNDPKFVGPFLNLGLTYSLVIKNRTTSRVTLRVISAE